MSTDIEVKSDTGGITLKFGESSIFMGTMETGALMRALHEAMAHCGQWSVPVYAIQPPAKVTGDR